MENCLFCKIAAGQIPSQKVYEDDRFLAFLDIGPASKGHTLIIPKEHADNLMELPDETAACVLPLAKRIAAAQKKTLGCGAVKLVQNNGPLAGQTVIHFHMHVIPCYDGTEVPNWNALSPESEELAAVREALSKEV